MTLKGLETLAFVSMCASMAITVTVGGSVILFHLKDPYMVLVFLLMVPVTLSQLCTFLIIRDVLQKPKPVVKVAEK